MTPPARRSWSFALVLRGALLVAALGGVALVAGAFVDPRQLAHSYLAAFAYWLGIALGALLLVMIHHVTDSTWFIVLRRLAEAAAGALLPLALLFLPLLAWLGDLYPWITPEALDQAQRTLVHERQPYQSAPFFAGRAALYFVVWVAVSQLLWIWSLRQDAGDGVALARRQRVLSAAALPLVGLTLTLASFDWLMSLSVEWASTIFGAYYFTGGAVGALALLCVVAHLAQRAGRLTDMVRVSHYHALGKLLLTFVILWTYVAYAQYYLVWIADQPHEAVWYLHRTHASWFAVAMLLIAGHFVLPFLALLSRTLKRRPAALASVGAWLLLMHYVDVHWLVLPALHREGVRPHWLDLAALLAIGGVLLAFVLWRLRDRREVASGDPRFERSLCFETR